MQILKYNLPALLLLLFVMQGCAKSISLGDEVETDSDTSADDESGSDGDTDSDTDTDADADTDTDTDIDADSDADSDADGDTDTEETNIEVAVENIGGTVAYLDIHNSIRGERLSDDGPEAVVLEPGMCDWSCKSLEAAGFCIPPCLNWPGVFAILPGETYLLSWDGLLIERVWGDCPCYNTLAPPDGEYGLILDGYSSFACVEGDCPEPTETGYLDDREVDGEPVTFEILFTVPIDVSTVLIKIAP